MSGAGSFVYVDTSIKRKIVGACGVKQSGISGIEIKYYGVYTADTGGQL